MYALREVTDLLTINMLFMNNFRGFLKLTVNLVVSEILTVIKVKENVSYSISNIIDPNKM